MRNAMVTRASIFAAALGFACLLPATAHAQAEVAPDQYELSHTEITSAPSAKEKKTDFAGKLSLPYNVKCSGRNLRPGRYLISVKSEGTNRMITIHGERANVNIPARVVPANQGATGSTLIVRRSGQGRQLEGVYIEQLNATLYVQSVTIHGMIEHLPIS